MVDRNMSSVHERTIQNDDVVAAPSSCQHFLHWGLWLCSCYGCMQSCSSRSPTTMSFSRLVDALNKRKDPKPLRVRSLAWGADLGLELQWGWDRAANLVLLLLDRRHRLTSAR